MADLLLNTELLRALREGRGWDQLTLARQAGIDPSVISRLERGLQEDMRASVLLALARTLQTPVDLLLAVPVAPPTLGAELTGAIAALGDLAPAQQRQVAALLRAYVATLPEDAASS